MITKKELQNNGWRKFSWNNGSIIEYWKPIDRVGDFSRRLGVRFGEYKDTPPITYLFVGSSYLPLLHIQSYSQLQSLYSALYNPDNPSLREFVLMYANKEVIT